MTVEVKFEAAKKISENEVDEEIFQIDSRSDVGDADVFRTVAEDVMFLERGNKRDDRISENSNFKNAKNEN